MIRQRDEKILLQINNLYSTSIIEIHIFVIGKNKTRRLTIFLTYGACF